MRRRCGRAVVAASLVISGLAVAADTDSAWGGANSIVGPGRAVT
jgi:hypothetical protein